MGNKKKWAPRPSRDGALADRKLSPRRRGSHKLQPRIQSVAFCAIMIVSALVWPLTMRGMTDVSTTKEPSKPSVNGLGYAK